MTKRASGNVLYRDSTGSEGSFDSSGSGSGSGSEGEVRKKSYNYGEFKSRKANTHCQPLPPFSSSKPRVSTFGKMAFCCFLHPLELICVRQITSSNDHGAFDTIFSSAALIYSEKRRPQHNATTPQGSWKNLFTGVRTTMLGCLMPTSILFQVFVSGIMNVIKIRRFLAPASATTTAITNPTLTRRMSLNTFLPDLGYSLVILKEVLAEKGIMGIFVSSQATIYTLVPSFFALMGARFIVHQTLGRTTRAKNRRIRRDFFIRAFFEKATMPTTKKKKKKKYKKREKKTSAKPYASYFSSAAFSFSLSLSLSLSSCSNCSSCSTHHCCQQFSSCMTS